MGGETKAVRFDGVLYACLLALCAQSQGFAQEAHAKVPAELDIGRAASAAQQSDERIEYLFEAEAGLSYTIELEQHGLDFILTIEDPRGESRSYDSPLLRDERELVLLDGALAGPYRLSVHSEEYSGAVGRHSILIEPLAEGADAAAWRAMTAGAAANARGGEPGWAEAVAEYESAAALWPERPHSRNRAQALFSAAAVEYWNRSNWLRSAALASDAAALYDELGHDVLAAGALHLRAAALIEEATQARRTSSSGLPPDARALFAEALALFDDVLRTFEQHGKAYEAALVINNIGLTHYYMGEYRHALRRWQQAADAFEQLDEWGGELNALGNQAVIAAEEGLLVDAVAVLTRIVETLPTDRLHEYRALTLDNLATSHQLLGNLDEALQTYAEALALHRRLDDRKGEGQSLRGIGATYFALGYLDLAEEFLRSALPLVQQSGDGRSHEAVLRALGNVAFLDGDYEGAIAHHRAALELATAPATVAAEQVLLAKDLVAVDRHAEALALAREAITTAEAAGAKLLLADALEQHGRARTGLGESDAALEDLMRAAGMYRELAVKAKEAEALHGMALAAASAGRLEEAVDHGEAALATLETVRGSVSDPELRAYYAAARRTYYETQIDMLMALHSASASGAADRFMRAAFETSERSRARMLVDLLHETRIDSRDGEHSALLAARARLVDRLAELDHRRDLLLEASPATPAQQQEIANVVREMVGAESELRVLETTLRRSGAHAGLAAPSTLSLDEIQAALDVDSVLLQYALGETRSHAWIVTRDSVEVVELAPRSALETAARNAYDALTEPRIDERGRRDLDARLDALAAQIVAPVLPHVDRRRIVVASDGALQYIPFGVLPDSVESDGRPLLDRHEVVAVPSMSAVAAQRRSPPSAAAGKTLAVIADPVFGADDVRLARAGSVPASIAAAQAGAEAQDDRLTDLVPRSALLGAPLPRLPYSGLEATAIAELVPAADRLVLTGIDASRRNVLESDLSGYRFVHFATHGVVDSKYPALSGLALSSMDARSAPSDEFLRLDDIRALELDAELVVLSACETALGREIRGEGLLGLTQAFLYAGARGTVASLWQVPDRATAELMSRFYEGMLEHDLPPAEALRAAQLRIASERRWSDPYFWGAFVMMGDWR